MKSIGHDPESAVDRLDRHQYAHLRRDLDQDATSHNARLSPARSDVEASFNWIGCGYFRTTTNQRKISYLR